MCLCEWEYIIDLGVVVFGVLNMNVKLWVQVVEMSWNRREVVDPTVYTGLLGTAFTCLRSYQVTGCRKDLLLCSEIIDTCAAAARASLRYFL